MVAARWTGTRVVVVDCPACRRPLPPIPVDYDTRADGPTAILVDLRPRIDDAYLTACRATHPRCFPRDAVVAT